MRFGFPDSMKNEQAFLSRLKDALTKQETIMQLKLVCTNLSQT